MKIEEERGYKVNAQILGYKRGETFSLSTEEGKESDREYKIC